MLIVQLDDKCTLLLYLFSFSFNLSLLSEYSGHIAVIITLGKTSKKRENQMLASLWVIMFHTIWNIVSNIFFYTLIFFFSCIEKEYQLFKCYLKATLNVLHLCLSRPLNLPNSKNLSVYKGRKWNNWYRIFYIIQKIS